MKFLVITHAPYKELNGEFYSYGPFVREMNIWFSLVGEIRVVAPRVKFEEDSIDSKFLTTNQLSFTSIPSFNTLTGIGKIKSAFIVPLIFFKCVKEMMWADHIHLRCPGNLGLIGLVAQIFFPFKSKTVKYAGNWDDYSGEHLSYKIQKFLSRNTFLSHNMRVLIYGQWNNFTRNCVSFFTASYTESEFAILPKKKRVTDPVLKFLFAGTLDERKRPDLSIEAVRILIASGITNIELDIVGIGPYRERCEKLITEYGLQEKVFLRGNVSQQEIKHYYSEAHFLVFISRMEGWPKVVAEAMSWGCVPITTAISCVPWMLHHQSRGRIVPQDASSVAIEISKIVKGEIDYEVLSTNAVQWSRQYTLEKFKSEIKTFL